jgi:2-keto-4-pentenoate hydratase/2-oxohepta-3-ene-1,7-dioic acid hydratase in catechol pathway
MRLCSFGERGGERPALLVGDRIIPIASLDAAAPASARALIAGGRLQRLAELAAAGGGVPVPLAGVRLGPPVFDAGKIICIGLNYRDHAAEQGKEHPPEPLLFAKTANTLAGPEDDIRHPAAEVFLDYEVELAVVIGARCSGVPASRALAQVAGVMVANDVSARRWQRGDGQWYRGKSCDTFLPCGPALVSLDEAGELAGLRLSTRVNGELRQDAGADQLIHDVPALIAYISRDITLEPGDIICTGTPAGVGSFRTPPVALAAGDRVECAISGLGILRNRVARDG